MRKRKTSDAVKILDQRFIRRDRERKESVESEYEKSQISVIIYQLRKQAGLTQKQLAVRVGTTQSVISKLEDADYEGQSLSMLNRIAVALHCKVKLEIVPDSGYAHAC
jgi:ribosome-binding protein aMBF1 (putative translation factor)